MTLIFDNEILNQCIVFGYRIGEVSWLARCMRFRWLMWMGSIAYGAYMYHQVVRGTIFGIILGERSALSDMASVNSYSRSTCDHTDPLLFLVDIF